MSNPPWPPAPSYPGPPASPGWQLAPPPPPRKAVSRWVWVVIVLGGLLLVACGGGFAFLTYVGAVGPDTKVYAGNEVPRRFTDTLRELNLLESGEQIRFFYSDGFMDIRNGCYFVSDRKVVVYNRSAATPATAVRFDDIEDVQFDPSDSTWVDGSITLTLKDGNVVGFPVSAEQGRDKMFYNAILDSVKRGSTAPAGPEDKQ